MPPTQHCLSRAIDEASFDALLASAPNTRPCPLIGHSTCRRLAKCSALGLHLHDREFRFCLQYWLGLRMFNDNRRCPVCQDPLGDHQLGCGGNSDRILRHNSLRDAVSAAQSAALAPRREAPSLVPGSQSRPADIYLTCWKRGHPVAVDVTVISTMQRSTIQGAAENQGHALLASPCC